MLTDFNTLPCFDDFSLSAILVAALDAQNMEIPLFVISKKTMIQAAEQN